MFRCLSSLVALTACLFGGQAHAEELTLESSYFAPCVTMLEADANDLMAGDCLRSARFQYVRDHFGGEVERSLAEEMAASRGWLGAPWVVAMLLETYPDSPAVLYTIGMMTDSEHPTLARGHLVHAATLLEAQGLLEEVALVSLYAATILPDQGEDPEAWGEEGLRLVDSAEAAWSASAKQLDTELLGDSSMEELMQWARGIAERHITRPRSSLRPPQSLRL